MTAVVFNCPELSILNGTRLFLFLLPIAGSWSRVSELLDVDHSAVAVCVTIRLRRTEIGTMREERNAGKPQRSSQGKIAKAEYA